jgi:hypothetical protein
MADSNARYPGNPERVRKVSRVREADMEVIAHSAGPGTSAAFSVNAFPNSDTGSPSFTSANAALRLSHPIHRLMNWRPDRGTEPSAFGWGHVVCSLTNARLHADQTWQNIREPRFDLGSRPLLPQHDCAAFIETNEVERV